jgi:FG-GAP-like repeat
MKAFFLTTLLFIAFTASSWAQSFAIYDLQVKGSVTSVMPADLNGDRRMDLVVISKTGTFPNVVRWLSVFWQQEAGRFNQQPDLVWEMDPEATVIDVGSLSSEANHEAIVYLTSAEVRAYHIKAGVRPTPTTLLKIPSVAAFPEPGELASWPLIYDWKGTGRVWLGIPQFGKLSLYSIGSDGALEAAESVQIHQPTFIFGVERDQRLLRDYSLQLVYRMPQLFVQDFNGDGRADLIVAWQDHVAVYLQDAARRFPAQASKTFHFDVRTEQERSRRSIFVSPLIADLNGDGRADLILTKMTGRVTDRHLVALVYLNRDGTLSSRPDARLEHEGFGTTLLIKDLNGDGKQDLIFPLVKIGVTNIVRNLLSNRVEVSLLAHLYPNQGIYRASPDWLRNFSYQIDMSDGIMLEGAWPNVEGDFDGDGQADLLVARNDELAVYLAAPGMLFAREPALRLSIKTSPHLLVRDLRHSGRADVVMWYEGQSDSSSVVKVLMNTGQGWRQR